MLSMIFNNSFCDEISTLIFYFVYSPCKTLSMGIVMSAKGLTSNRFSLSGSALLHGIESPAQIQAPVADIRPPAQHTLPTGHHLSINFEESIIDVTTPTGEPAVHITLTENGPVVEVAGAKLSLKSPQDINIACENFSVETEKDLYMNSNGGLIIESTQELQLNCEVDVHIRAKVIWLN